VELGPCGGVCCGEFESLLEDSQLTCTMGGHRSLPEPFRYLTRSSGVVEHIATVERDVVGFEQCRVGMIGNRLRCHSQPGCRRRYEEDCAAAGGFGRDEEPVGDRGTAHCGLAPV